MMALGRASGGRFLMLCCNVPNRFSRFLALAGLGAAAAVSPPVAASAHASITGVCPDGSIFIVQRPEAIPCRNAKQVEPDAVPPLKPEFLPRPYAWEVFNEKQDPNNPYNLIDSVREPRDRPERQVRRADPHSSPSALPDPRAQAAPPSAPSGAGLALTDDDIRDLALIVELAQQRAPATLTRTGTDGEPSLVVRFARSEAFDERLRLASAEQGGPAAGPGVLFSAIAMEPDRFDANLTFVQGHVAFQPDVADPSQLGLLRGQLGALAAEASVLGYVVLPAHMDLSRPIDIYWNDRQLTATLRR